MSPRWMAWPLLAATACPVHAASIFLDGFETCAPALDSDADRLDDCTELQLGTAPGDADTDDDGLPDGDEVLGTAAGLDLPAFGVSPRHKDVLVEVDWMTGPECGAGFDRRLTEANIADARAVLAAAPVANPDGVPGIRLHVDAGQGGQWSGGNVIAGPDALLEGVLYDAMPEFRVLRLQHQAANRVGYFHYAIMAWRFSSTSTSNSGQAEIGGDEFIVSLQCTANESLGATTYTNTFLHELGHNLALRHGGNNECNHRPNYDSLMNYRYQIYGNDYDCDGHSDFALGTFSAGQRADIDEAHVDESRGLCGAPLDLNYNNGIEADVAIDLNAADTGQAATCGGTHTLLRDHDDWAALKFHHVQVPGDGAPLAEVSACAPL